LTTASIEASTTRFLMLTPLPNWKGPEEPITAGIAIRRLSPPERASLESSDALLDHHDIGQPARDGYWLCYDFENDYPPDNVRYRRRQDAAFKLMLHAMYSAQILAPVGATNLLLLYKKSDSGLVLDSTQRRQAFIETVWSRICPVPASFRDDVPLVLERLRQAFQQPILRLQIPIWLLEQGMGAPDRHIRILLWATGLDAITRSGGTVAFCDRLCQLLGSDAQIFPTSTTGLVPRYKVIDVAADLYQLRTEMAHGLPFHEKFRKKRGFVIDGDQPISPDFADYRYDQVLEECAGFLLCKALREILLRNCLFDVHANCWNDQG
jgi:hypothetical protein